jgi:hypothetical protein
MRIREVWSQKCIWEIYILGYVAVFVEFKQKDKALQRGKLAFSLLEELVKVGPRPFKGNLVHAIVMSKCGTHAPKGTASKFPTHALVVDEYRQRTRQDLLDMARFFTSHGNAQIQTGGRRVHDSTPPFAYTGEIKPHIFFSPLKIVGFDALSMGIEYL